MRERDPFVEQHINLGHLPSRIELAAGHAMTDMLRWSVVSFCYQSIKPVRIWTQPVSKIVGIEPEFKNF